MKQAFLSSYAATMAVVTKAKRWTMAAGTKFKNVWLTLKPWMVAIFALSALLLLTPVFVILLEFFLVFVPAAIIPTLVELFLLIAKNSPEDPFPGFEARWRNQMIAITGLPIHTCLFVFSNIYISVSLSRCATRMIQKQLKVNMDLCTSYKGPSRGVRCGVCWGDMAAEDETYLHKLCKNSWHATCIESIARYEQGAKGWAPCPLCRQPLNAESKIARTFRTLPSSISLHTERLEQLSRRIFYASNCFAAIVLGAYLSKDKFIDPSLKEPSQLLVVTPALITLAVFFSATAFALGQLHMLEQCFRLGPYSGFTHLWANTGCLLALIIAGRQIQVPAALSFGQLLTVGLGRTYSHTPSLATMHWWDWTGLTYHIGVSFASAVLVGALAVANGVLVLD